MIHRAPFGSLERFVAVLIEHCAGNFPLWLTPEAIAVLPISEKYHEYAQKVVNVLNKADIRGLLDDRNEKVGRKIRDAEMKKIPFMLVVGEQEMQTETIAVRKHGGEEVGKFKLDEFVSYFNEQLKVD